MQRGAYYQQPRAMQPPKKQFNGKRYSHTKGPKAPPSPLDGWPRGPISGQVKHIGGLESSPFVNNVKH